MRVALGSLGDTVSLANGNSYDYPFPRGSFTLANGRQISDPAVDQPQGDDCQPYLCGVTGDDAILMWCGFWGKSGTKAGCVDPECANWRNLIPYCSLPQVPASTPYAAPPPPLIPTLTPENIVQPLPDITTVLQPQPVQIECGTWAQVNNVIAENPLLAGLVLAGFAFAVFHHSKGKRR